MLGRSEKREILAQSRQGAKGRGREGEMNGDLRSLGGGLFSRKGAKIASRDPVVTGYVTHGEGSTFGRRDEDCSLALRSRRLRDSRQAG